MNKEEYDNVRYDGLLEIIENGLPPQVLVSIFDMLGKTDIANEIYKPSSKLVAKLQEFDAWRSRHQKGEKAEDTEKAGKLMEEIAFLAVLCLKGCNSVESYQSYAAQIDLLASGQTMEWYLLMTYLNIKEKYSSIVVEAKNMKGKVDDKSFSRFCYHLQNMFASTAHLGIFFTRFGVTGMPINDTESERDLSYSRATQLLFHAKSGKFVVVLSEQDILSLSQEGALPRILRNKILEVERGTGRPVPAEQQNISKVNLPKHLSQHL